MDVSQFNPDTFLDATYTETLEKRPPLDAGEYQADIRKLKTRTWQGKKDPTMSGIALDIQLEVEIPTEARQGGKLPEKLVLFDSIMLDLNEGGMIDRAPGANRKLRNYLEAAGLNQPGQPWAPRMLEGRRVKVRTSQEIYENEPREKIDGVVKP